MIKNNMSEKEILEHLKKIYLEDVVKDYENGKVYIIGTNYTTRMYVCFDKGTIIYYGFITYSEYCKLKKYHEEPEHRYYPKEESMKAEVLKR